MLEVLQWQLLHTNTQFKISVIDKKYRRLNLGIARSDNLPVYEPGLSKIIEVTKQKSIW